MSPAPAVLKITAHGAAVRFPVHVQPRSSRAGVDGMRGDTLRVRVHAAPVEGAANAAVIEVIAEALDVPKRSVRIVHGDTSRTKVVEVDGIGVDAARSRLGV